MKQIEKNIEKAHHLKWEDDLIHDVCGGTGEYLPPDFEETLKEVEDEFLSDEEAEIVNRFYIDRQSTREIAVQMHINDQSVREKKKHALSILHDHRSDLIRGKEYIRKSQELKAEYKNHYQELSWMKSAISYIHDLSDEENEIIDEEEISDEAKRFYRINGFTYLADVMGVDPGELFVELTNLADDAGVFLAVSGNNMGLSPNTFLTDVDFKEQTIRAFHEAGYTIVGDVLSLDEEDVSHIPGVGLKQIVHLYRRIIFG